MRTRLDKNDTVHQWNLRVLDLSGNNLERTVFINNTLINLCTLNLSYNRLWTFPTNMPARLEIVDISHNSLVKVLPGSLDRLSNLSLFYLHNNRLSELPVGVFDKMASLRVLTLGNNPWACHLDADVSYLLSWVQRTAALVLGCPCRPQPICGGVKTGLWNFTSFGLPPGVSRDSMKATTTINDRPDSSASAAHTRHVHFHGASNETPPGFSFTGSTPKMRVMTKRPMRISDYFLATESTTVQVKKTSSFRTKSVRRKDSSSSGGVNVSQTLVNFLASFLLVSLASCL
ncbi:oligodendrocyte-myelin glycoprotein [Festucalex cinctus]